ncbi:MAG TPA: hypothetical protein VFO60_01310, partial [Candidatus Dormibacteraeota bacterium]|nr:hypothetical protein [Candidatus Dormibacteraeota bacterium]
SLAGLVGSGAVVAVSVAPVLVPGPRLLEGAEVQQMALSPADEAFLAHLPDIVPSGDLILTDGTADSGGWIEGLTTSRTLLTKGWEQSSAAPTVEAALRGLCSAGSSTRLRGLGVTWVYLGTAPATSQPYADRSCPEGTDELRVVDVPGSQPSGPRLYQVSPG